MCLFLVSNAQALSFSSNLFDKPSLVRGAKVFMDYCSGCHSLKYMRYKRMAEDLGYIVFLHNQASPYDPILVAMSSKDAKQWFGVVPPDLSLITREKGLYWLYIYLKSFYNDTSRPFGVNNVLKPNVAMPNVLEPLLGEEVLGPKGHLLLAKQGSLSQSEVRSLLQDLVGFLAYVGEPEQKMRYRMGLIVLGFLVIFLFLVLGLKRAYWKKIV